MGASLSPNAPPLAVLERTYGEIIIIIIIIIIFCGGKKGNASCTVTLVRRVWDSSTARRWEQPPVGRSAA